MKIPANGFTHAGKFHADDVFATALLQILRPDIKITRGFVVPDDFDGIVYDIGFGMFDHHQEPREYRANGVPYAAFGLLWRVLGPGLVGERQARLIDENFIQPLDLNDNTGERQRRQPGRRESPAGLPELPGWHRGAALLPALEKRSV